MTSLTVWCFDTPVGAEAGALRLKGLEQKDALVVHDAVELIWMPGADEPTVRQLRHGTGEGSAKGAFWGGVAGIFVLAPIAGAAVGGAVGGLVARLRRGVSDDFIARVREQITPGTSALLVLSSNAKAELIGPAIEAMDATLLIAELDDDLSPELRALVPETGPSAG
ncbi:DUF1269 domain-containing protein [Nocardioides sp. URHA0020]|uniref:DUF1269 domain-containing protein n=1 Tax=Nocardioides sp. URHA0020 TaxID=1380392 RepID=UPI0004914C86|nr:DUF1269 domain-containing protein [Nocardioides sp. URHA0020]